MDKQELIKALLEINAEASREDLGDFTAGELKVILSWIANKTAEIMVKLDPEAPAKTIGYEIPS